LKPSHQGSGNRLTSAFVLLLIIIAFAPALMMTDGLVAHSIVAALAAAALAVVAFSARAADVDFAARVTRRLTIVAAVPAIWMAVQVAPVPVGAHSIWINSNEALNERFLGHISIDIGMTVEALAFYLASIALIVVSLFVVKDRRRAELVLFALAAITTVTTLALLVAGLTAGFASGVPKEVLSAFASLGVVLLLAIGLHALERREGRQSETRRSSRNARLATIACGLGFLICLAGLVTNATLNVGLVTAFGLVMLGAIQAIRRVGQARWTAVIFLVTITIAAAMIIVWRYDSSRGLSSFLQFATSAPSDAISVTRRMLSDTGWLGTGAGTYAALSPIYQEFGSSVARAPTTVSAYAIELGRAMVLYIIAAVLGLVAILYGGALLRGRDSFYPAAAAACVIIVVGQAFCDASLLNAGVGVVCSAVIGLGLAQSVSTGGARS
jgi:hypothetical protein